MAEEKNQKSVPSQEQSDLDVHSEYDKTEYDKKIKKYKKQAARSFVFAFTTLIAIIAVCIAWFVNNTQVNVSGIKIAAHNSLNFELATAGNETVIDTKKKSISDFITKIGGIIGGEYSIPDAQKGTITSATKSSIQWNMSSAHQNFANVEGSGIVDGTGDENIGLQPGTYGELTFYIIPKIDGEQTVNCTLQLTAYADEFKKSLVKTSDSVISFNQNSESEVKEVWEITDPKVGYLLSGHIYFFTGKDTIDTNTDGTSKEVYDSWLKPDKYGTLQFRVDLGENTKKDEPKKVTIYWDWPTLISQVLLKDGDKYLGGRDQLFSNAAQKNIVDFMCDSTSDNSSFFFVSNNNSEISSNQKELVQKIYKYSWKQSGDSFSSEEYSTINQLYNNADQFLGRIVSYVSLELTATN